MMDLKESGIAASRLSDENSRHSSNIFSSVGVKSTCALVHLETVNTSQRDFIILRKALLHPLCSFSRHFCRSSIYMEHTFPSSSSASAFLPILTYYFGPLQNVFCAAVSAFPCILPCGRHNLSLQFAYQGIAIAFLKESQR